MIPLIFSTIFTTYSQLPLKTEWDSLGENIEYELQYSFTQDFRYIEISHWPTTNTYEYTQSLQNKFYCRRLRYREIGTEGYSYKNLDCFYFDSEYIPPVQEETTQEQEILEEEIPPLPAKPKEIFNERESMDTEVLGIQDTEENLCNISILKRGSSYEILNWDCKESTSVTSSIYINWGKYYSTEISGTYLKDIDANISIYSCKKFSLRDFSTWGKCKKVLLRKYRSEVLLVYTGNIYIGGRWQRNYNFSFKESEFFLSTLTKEDPSEEQVSLSFIEYISILNGKEWIDLRRKVRIPVEISEKSIEKKPFGFPIDRDIGVTQWYGCTKYQCPHKGIDFGARLNRVISVGDGTVTKVGYDKYGGECNQGGNYVIVKHTNGMHTTYFHLDHYKVQVGSTVKKGDLLGVSGNTGKWNCQKLGYHLHFETRKGQSSSTHVNPVGYIDIDWNMIPTLGKDVFPDRLSGENPHPNF